ncbi:MAG: nitrogen regulation protein NR(II) [Myxococcales bacterium]|nr:PAS domain S-box protein [Myxococcales bacterium]
MGERGALVEARQLAGLLRAGGTNARRREAALTRLAQLAARGCDGREPADAARSCAALRDVVLDLAGQQAVDVADARALCRTIDAAEAEAMEAFNGSRQAQHALQTFESLIEASPLPILSVDRRGLVRIWNRAAEELFGWQRVEVLGKPLPFVPPESQDESRAMAEASMAGEVIRNREVRRARKDGAILDLALSVAPLRDTRGEISGSIAILADIGERKQREMEGEQTARFREHLIGVVGHDLRNPLTAIVTSAQLLLRYAGLSEKQSRVVGRIASSADRMARMIDDLLDFARTRLGGGFPIHPRRIDLRELCEHTVEELEFAYATRTVRLETDGDLWGNWDPDRMAQVISNLVGNALQHSSEDGEVRVRLHGEPEVVVLQTHNGGSPIPPDVLPHVFEPGRRGARSGGLGLGLYIVEQVVLAHGGSIEARSTAEEGTTFTVVLPRKARHKA